MIRLRLLANVLDAIPQAIFWRPVSYFATDVREEEDDLDVYEVASFDIGNEHYFDLRWYHGHPELTSTLYLPAFIEDTAVIFALIREVIGGLSVPTRAVAWRRGQRIPDDGLLRPDADILREDEARVLALKFASTRPDGYATTSEIKQAIPEMYPLSPLDLAPSKTRVNEQRWQQIVGNVISHQSSPYSLFSRGLAVRTPDGLRVTEEGRIYLNNIGFSS